MSIEDEAGLHRNAEMYIQTSSEMSNAQSQTKEIREKRKSAKEYIINSMKTANLQYVECGGKFLVLKSKLQKPVLNELFYTEAYSKFHETVGDIPKETWAEKFGLFFVSWVKHMSDPSDDLQLMKKKPHIAARMFHELQK